MIYSIVAINLNNHPPSTYQLQKQLVEILNEDATKDSNLKITHPRAETSLISLADCRWAARGYNARTGIPRDPELGQPASW